MADINDFPNRTFGTHRFVLRTFGTQEYCISLPVDITQEERVQFAHDLSEAIIEQGIPRERWPNPCADSPAYLKDWHDCSIEDALEAMLGNENVAVRFRPKGDTEWHHWDEKTNLSVLTTSQWQRKYP